MLSLFRRRRFPVEIILLCVRWYCKSGINYRDLSEMMKERGVNVDLEQIIGWARVAVLRMRRRHASRG